MIRHSGGRQGGITSRAFEYQYLNRIISRSSFQELVNISTQSPAEPPRTGVLNGEKGSVLGQVSSRRATDPSYGPRAKYGDPRRGYEAQNVYAQGTYVTRYMPSHSPHSAQYTQVAPPYTDRPGDGHQHRGYEAPYHEPCLHMDYSHYSIAKNPPPATYEAEESENESESSCSESRKQQGLLTAGSTVLAPMF